MPDGQYNLLTEPLFSVVTDAGQREQFDLPSVFEALGTRSRLEFSALQAHQQQAWYSFLVQLAAIVLPRAGEPSPRHDAARWRAWLRNLTGQHDEPWCLVVQDLSRPAFMQTPVSEGELTRYKNCSWTPGALDVLVTSKNHEVKMQRALHAAPEHWSYALLTLQTLQGYLGRGNYGIARMNGGAASRPFVSCAPSLEWPDRFRRDVTACLEARAEIVASHGYRAANGLTLLWLKDWDGRESLPLSDCDPFFIEVCRLVRAVLRDDEIVVLARPTEGRRLQAKERHGDLGDPWMPISKESGKALTIAHRGFDYRRTRDLLLGSEFEAAALRLRSDDGDTPYFIASVLARGQGKTEGLRHREVRIPRQARRLLGTPQGRARLEERSKRRIEMTVQAQRSVLRPALRALFEPISTPENLLQRWVGKHDRLVDRAFFEDLWSYVDRPDAQTQVAWQRKLLKLAQDVLERAIQTAPLPVARRYQSIANAERLFRALARKHFPDAMLPAEDEHGPSPAQR